MSDSDFWYKIAAVSFGAWAVMIPVGIGMIRGVLARSTSMQEKFLTDFHSYVLQMERRVVALEQEVKFMTRRSRTYNSDEEAE
jgi:hypothetical protein